MSKKVGFQTTPKFADTISECIRRHPDKKAEIESAASRLREEVSQGLIDLADAHDDLLRSYPEQPAVSLSYASNKRHLGTKRS